jgi:lipopolysaccharide transport system permease protein
VKLRATVIRPERSWSFDDLREVWEYRDLLSMLVWRDLQVRYRQAVLGVAWAVIQPVTAVIVFSLVFGRFARVPSDGLPYPAFSYTGMLVWSYVAHAVTQAAQSLPANVNLVTRTYVPRVVIPLAAIVAGLPDLAIALLVLAPLLAWYGIVPGAGVVLVPALLLLAVGVALALGLWLSALNVRYRDVRHALPFLMQVWLFATPVVYPASMMPGRWRMAVALNPMAGVVEGLRSALLGSPFPGDLVLCSAAVTLLLLVSGAVYFRRAEQRFADVI